MGKRLFNSGVAISLLLSSGGAVAESKTLPEDNKLIILNWAEYLDPALIKKFEQQFHVIVSEIYYESDEHRTQILFDNNAEGFDLIVTSGINLESYVRRGWIAPLNLKNIPNRSHINQRWLTAFPFVQKYAIPYFWGTTGILYRTDKIDYKITSWMDLFAPEPLLKNKIGMFSDGYEITGLALKGLGYSVNEGNPDALKQAEALLIHQKDYVRSYQYFLLDKNSEILTGDIWMTVAYNGDALMVMNNSAGDNLNFVIPEEGSDLWVDYFTVGTHANRPDLAHLFINFMNQPDNAAQAAHYTYSATPNDSAKKLMPADYLSNPIIFPSDEILAKSEQFEPIQPRQIKRRNDISAKIVSTQR